MDGFLSVGIWCTTSLYVLRSNAITGPFIAGPPSDCLQVLEGDHPSENIDCWTARACVCIRRAALERNCKCLCVYLSVCCACLSLCTDGEIGEERHPEGKGYSPCTREKGNSIFLNTLLPNAPAFPSLCFPLLLIACTYTYVWSSWAFTCCIHIFQQGSLLPTSSLLFSF